MTSKKMLIGIGIAIAIIITVVIIVLVSSPAQQGPPTPPSPNPTPPSPNPTPPSPNPTPTPPAQQGSPTPVPALVPIIMCTQPGEKGTFECCVPNCFYKGGTGACMAHSTCPSTDSDELKLWTYGGTINNGVWASDTSDTSAEGKSCVMPNKRLTVADQSKMTLNPADAPRETWEWPCCGDGCFYPDGNHVCKPHSSCPGRSTAAVNLWNQYAPHSS